MGKKSRNLRGSYECCPTSVNHISKMHENVRTYGSQKNMLLDLHPIAGLCTTLHQPISIFKLQQTTPIKSDGTDY